MDAASRERYSLDQDHSVFFYFFNSGDSNHHQVAFDSKRDIFTDELEKARDNKQTNTSINAGVI